MIKPEEILDRKFKKVFRGYDPVEVKYFLEMLADEIGKYEKRISDFGLKEEGETEIKSKEADSIVKAAAEKAAEIVISAEKRVAQIIREAKMKKIGIEDTIRQLRHKRDELVRALRKVVDSQSKNLSMIEDENVDFDDRIAEE